MIEKYGRYSLIAGVAVAVLMGLFPSLRSDATLLVLVVLGVAAGFLSGKGQRAELLTAAVALMLAGRIGLPHANETVGAVLGNVSVLSGAAAVVLALRTILGTGRERR